MILKLLAERHIVSAIGAAYLVLWTLFSIFAENWAVILYSLASGLRRTFL